MQAGDQQGEQGEQGEHGGQGEQEEPGEHGRIGEHGEPVAHVEHGEQGELEEKKEYREHGEQGVALNDAEETEIRDIDVNDDEPAEIPVIVPDITASNENIDDGSIQDIVDATFKETGEADDDDDEEKLLEDCSADQGEAAAGQGDEQPQASVGSEEKSAGPEQSLAANSKKTSAVLERKESDGSSFWSLSARNSVVSMFDPGQEVTDEQDGGEAETLLQSPRKMLQKKRSSLSHKPDIVRVFEKKSLQDQETDNVHEFQKVMCGLKHVEDPSYDLRKVSSSGSARREEEVNTTQQTDNQHPQHQDSQLKQDKAAPKQNKKKAVVNSSPAVRSSSKPPPPETRKEGSGSAGQRRPDPLKKTNSRTRNAVPAKQPLESTSKSLEKGEKELTAQNKLSKSRKSEVIKDSIKKPPTGKDKGSGRKDSADRQASKKPAAELSQDSEKIDAMAVPPSPKPVFTETDSKKGMANSPLRRKDKLQKAPTVKRTMSLRVKSDPSKVEEEAKAKLKRSSSLKKQNSCETVSTQKERPMISRSSLKNKTLKEDNSTKVMADQDPAKSDTQRKVPPAVAPKPRRPASVDSINKKSPPPVAPKPIAPNRFTLESDLPRDCEENSNSSTMKTTAVVTLNQAAPVKPIVKKMANKTSIAEMAKFADSQALEVVLNETLHQAQFVSQAKATLSPVPRRKQLGSVAGGEEEDDDDDVDDDDANNCAEESGIVSETVSASSVIAMFGGVGKFKRASATPPETPTDEKPEHFPASDTKESKKKPPELRRTLSKKSSSEKLTAKEKHAPKPASSKIGIKKSSINTIGKQPSFESSTNKNDPKETSKTKSQTRPTQSRTNSTKSGKVIRKTPSEKNVLVSGAAAAQEEEEDSPGRAAKQAGSVVKTTMTVRLHPGQNRKLSSASNVVGGEAAVEPEQTSEQGAKPAGLQRHDSVGWRAELQDNDDPASVCGLEISFKSVPQDIDIKLISGEENFDADDKKDLEKEKTRAKNSISRKSIDPSRGNNKTRQ